MIVKRYKIRAKHYRKEPVTPPGRGFRSVLDHTTEEEIEVSIDMDRIVSYLGQRAVANSRGYATQAGGIIKVKHIRPRKKKGGST